MLCFYDNNIKFVLIMFVEKINNVCGIKMSKSK